MAARKTNQNENRRQQTAACHLRALYHQLAERFGPQQWWPAKSAFEVVVGAYLTQNTAWTSVERSIANLSARGALTPAGLRPVDETELRQLIRPSGFMLRKAAALKAFVAFLDAKYDGAMERLREAAAEDQARVREELLALPGVGNETADAILLYALGRAGDGGGRVSAPCHGAARPPAGEGDVPGNSGAG